MKQIKYLIGLLYLGGLFFVIPVCDWAGTRGSGDCSAGGSGSAGGTGCPPRAALVVDFEPHVWAVLVSTAQLKCTLMCLDCPLAPAPAASAAAAATAAPRPARLTPWPLPFLPLSSPRW